jgi:2-polyprenyl-6-methoxyphenol hydroxylase-like FAD-dependent oxidoreductase
MKVLIVGGGIAGVTLAGLLQKQHNVTLIEKSLSWRTIGFLVGIWKNGLDILKKLPLTQEFWDSGYHIQKGAVLSDKRKILLQNSFKGTDGESLAFTFERDTLHKALHVLIDSAAVRFNTTVKSLNQSTSGVEVEFSNGIKEKFDIVVGADGLRSNTRLLVFGDKLKDYGWNILGTWVPTFLQPFPEYYVLSGKNETIMGFPFRDRYVTGFMYKAKNSNWPKPPENAQAMLDIFPRLKDEIQDMIPVINDLSTMFCDKLQYVAMDDWYKGRVILIGDARHGMSPLTGMGVSLALEDAWVLSEELNKSTDVTTVFENFTQRRNMRLESVKSFRWRIEKAGMINSLFGGLIRNLILRFTLDTPPGQFLRDVFETKI